jgi:hypothetical protein
MLTWCQHRNHNHIMNRVITWNTGRMYSKHGQRMAAVQLDHNRIYFLDLDRNIDGCLITSNQRWDQATVMAAYDHHLYTEGCPLDVTDRYDLRNQMREAAEAA